MSWERDLISWEQDLISWERDNYVVGSRSYVVGTRSIIFFTCPLSAAVQMRGSRKILSRGRGPTLTYYYFMYFFS